MHGSNAPFALFFAELVDPALGPLVAVFAAIAALGAINGFVLLQGELPLSLARDGLLPALVRARRTATRRPIGSTSSRACSPPLLVLVNYSRGLADLFQFMVLVTTSVTIIFYLAGALAERQAGARRAGSRPRPASPRSPPRASLYSLWAFYGAGIEASLWSLAMTAAGVPVYLLMRRANRSSPAAAANPAASPESAA